jgi:hypothetical protein
MTTTMMATMISIKGEREREREREREKKVDKDPRATHREAMHDS